MVKAAKLETTTRHEQRTKQKAKRQQQKLRNETDGPPWRCVTAEGAGDSGQRAVDREDRRRRWQRQHNDSTTTAARARGNGAPHGHQTDTRIRTQHTVHSSCDASPGGDSARHSRDDE